MHEARMHEASSFVTLTYDDEHYSPSLNYLDFQRFMYRLRKKLGPTRFFMCGEYGDKNWRPHFHALLFGQSFSDRKAIGESLYRSPTLESLWDKGFSSVGDVTYQSAAYVARYSLKKVSGDRASSHYSKVDGRTGEVINLIPEFGRMSLKPGIGFNWFQKYWKDVFLARDGVVINGKTVPAPRYYMQLLDSIDSDLKDEKELQRYINSGKFAADCSPQRLIEREICAIAKEKFRKERYL